MNALLDQSLVAGVVCGVIAILLGYRYPWHYAPYVALVLALFLILARESLFLSRCPSSLDGPSIRQGNCDLDLCSNSTRVVPQTPAAAIAAIPFRNVPRLMDVDILAPLRLKEVDQNLIV